MSDKFNSTGHFNKLYGICSDCVHKWNCEAIHEEKIILANKTIIIGVVECPFKEAEETEIVEKTDG